MKARFAIGIMLGLLVLSVPSFAEAAGAPAHVPKNPGNTRFVVYYFHGKLRCPTCLKIEQLSARTIREAFAEQMDRGIMEWKAVDVDRPENKHYSTDYDLSSPTLVVARFEGAEMREFQKLDKVWEMVEGDERKFELYVFGEIERFLSK